MPSRDPPIDAIGVKPGNGLRAKTPLVKVSEEDGDVFTYFRHNLARIMAP